MPSLHKRYITQTKEELICKLALVNLKLFSRATKLINSATMGKSLRREAEVLLQHQMS